jgi:hypothetical protein
MSEHLRLAYCDNRPKEWIVWRHRPLQSEYGPGTEMSSVDAGHLASTYHHHQNSFSASVGLVFCKLADDAKANAAEFLRPMAILTSFSSRHEPIGLSAEGIGLGYVFNVVSTS